jgi:hypothetical protein
LFASLDGEPRNHDDDREAIACTRPLHANAMPEQHRRHSVGHWIGGIGVQLLPRCPRQRRASRPTDMATVSARTPVERSTTVRRFSAASVS